MNRYIVLLRGINVSGKNKLPMADLRELLNDLGFQNVQTYIQSGNIILDSDERKSIVCDKVKEGIANKFGYNVPVIARTIKEWEKAIVNNPYPIDNPKVLHFVFLSDKPSNTSIEVPKAEGDYYEIIDDVVYLYTLGGYGNSKMNINVFEKKLKVEATSRNLRTTMKLLELANES